MTLQLVSSGLDDNLELEKAFICGENMQISCVHIVKINGILGIGRIKIREEHASFTWSKLAKLVH